MSKMEDILLAYRKAACDDNNYPPDSRIIIEKDGVYLERICSNSFCCKTSLTERVKLR